MTSACPKCSSSALKRNGFTRHGKQNYRCLECGRQFSLEPERQGILVAKSFAERTDHEEKNADQTIIHI